MNRDPLLLNKVRQRTDLHRGDAYLRVSATLEETPMHQAEVFNTVTQQRAWSGLGPKDGQSDADLKEAELQRNRQFVSLLNAFRESGGLARANEVASQFQRRSDGNISVLGDWLLNRHAISFEWHSKLWMPLFQFNPSDMSLRAGLAGILAELALVYDDWDLAHWFVKPNAWLSEALPANALAVAAPQVLWAARAERSAQAANHHIEP